MAVAWNPDRYGLFGDHRGPPLEELLVRVRVEDPAPVVNPGSGPGPWGWDPRPR